MMICQINFVFNFIYTKRSQKLLKSIFNSYLISFSTGVLGFFLNSRSRSKIRTFSDLQDIALFRFRIGITSGRTCKSLVEKRSAKTKNQKKKSMKKTKSFISSSISSLPNFFFFYNLLHNISTMPLISLTYLFEEIQQRSRCLQDLGLCQIPDWLHIKKYTQITKNK